METLGKGFHCRMLSDLCVKPGKALIHWCECANMLRDKSNTRRSTESMWRRGRSEHIKSTAMSSFSVSIYLFLLQETNQTLLFTDSGGGELLQKLWAEIIIRQHILRSNYAT